MIYFITNESQTTVKIGYSSDPKRRLGSIQTGQFEKLLLFGTAPGTKKVEKHLHELFKKFRIRGEWFHFAPIKEQIVSLVLQDRKIRPNRSYTIEEFQLVTGLSELEIDGIHRLAVRRGLLNKASCSVYTSDEYRYEGGLLFTADHIDGVYVPSTSKWGRKRVRGSSWVKLEKAGCVKDYMTGVLF